MFLAHLPTPRPHYVCCCNHLIYRLWSHKNRLSWSQSQEFTMMRHDVHDAIRKNSLTNLFLEQLLWLPLCLVEPGACCHVWLPPTFIIRNPTARCTASACLMLRIKSGTRPLSNKRLLLGMALCQERKLGYDLSIQRPNKTTPFYLHHIRFNLMRAALGRNVFFFLFLAATFAEFYFPGILCFEFQRGRQKNDGLYNEAFLKIH